jgi:hypothetical protein
MSSSNETFACFQSFFRTAFRYFLDLYLWPITIQNFAIVDGPSGLQWLMMNLVFSGIFNHICLPLLDMTVLTNIQISNNQSKDLVGCDRIDHK